MKNIFLFMASLLILASFGCSKNYLPNDGNISYERINPNQYQNYLKKWDNSKQPVLFTVIKTAAEYNQYFAPAATMGPKKPFSPDPTFFDKNMIILVAREMKAPEKPSDSFKISQISNANNNLLVSYQYREPVSNAQYSVNNYLAIKVSKSNYNKIIFMENGVVVGTIIPHRG